MKRLFCFVLVLCLLFSFITASAFAANSEDDLAVVSTIQKCLVPLIEMAEQVSDSVYTPASYQTLSTALAAARALPTEKVTTVTAAELQNWTSTYNALYSAYYTGLRPQKYSFYVTLHYGSNMSARSTAAAGAGYFQTVTCHRGDTLSNLIADLGLDGEDYAYQAIINGHYVHFSYLNKTSNFILDPSKITLHPNDDIVLFTANPQTALGAALGSDNAYLMQYVNNVRLQRFSESAYTSEAARPFTVKVEETDPVLYHDGGEYLPAAGLTVFVSEPQTEKGGLVSTSPLTVNGEGVVTEENGEAELSFYEEGWVLVQAIDLTPDNMGNYTYYVEGSPILAGDYYSMESGASVWVHVTPSSRLSEVKTELLAVLEEEHAAYDQEIFPAARLSAFQSTYENAVAAIEAAGDTGTAYRAQQTGIVGMRTAYNNAVSDNQAALTRFRNSLNQLPDDVTLITQGEQTKINNLKNAYTGMTVYQKSQLLQIELQKYDAIVSLTDLGPARAYAVTVNIVADTPATTAAINDMVDWLNSEGRCYTGDNGGTAGGGTIVNKLYVPHSAAFLNESGYVSGPVAPGTGISMITNYNYSVWLPVLYRNQGTTYVGDKGDNYTKIEGNGWTVYDTADSGVQVVNSHVVGNMPVLIDGVRYEPKGISFSGIEGSVYHKNFTSYIEASGYKGKMGVNVYFDDPWVEFTMPYNDVTITVTWGPVDSSTETSAAADALTAAYNEYVPGNYSDAQWTTLTSIYREGIAAIRAAADPNAVKEEYLARMAAVPADFPGPLSGSVTVTVSNNTCADGPWYDETEPFVSETIDLYDTDTMMTVVLRALAKNEYTWEGTGGGDYGITYLSSVKLGVDELAEFTGGSGSGWMGMLNNWFVHQSFSEFSVENGTLKNGDRVEVVYTCDKGVDLRSGMEGLADTVMYNIRMTNGTLSPAFSGSTKEYVFTLDSGKDTSVLTFEPMWRCFQSRAYKGSYQPTGTNYYSSGDTVYLEDGDVLYVAAGDPAWPSMSGNSGVTLRASVYTITVVGSGNADRVQELIDELPNVKYNNYQACEGAVEAARTAYDALADSSAVDATRLLAAERLIAEYAELDVFKAELAPIKAADADAETARQLVERYDAMREEQKLNLTGAEVTKIEALREKLGPAQDILYGDLTGDEEITADDAAYLYAVVRGKRTLTDDQEAAADVNSDGEITADDAAILYAYLRGRITVLPIEN